MKSTSLVIFAFIGLLLMVVGVSKAQSNPDLDPNTVGHGEVLPVCNTVTCAHGVCNGTNHCNCYRNEIKGFWEGTNCNQCATDVELADSSFGIEVASGDYPKRTFTFVDTPQRFTGSQAHLAQCRQAVAVTPSDSYEISYFLWDRSLTFFKAAWINGRRHDQEYKDSKFRISDSEWNCRAMLGNLVTAIGENSICEFKKREMYVHTGANSQRGGGTNIQPSDLFQIAGFILTPEHFGFDSNDRELTFGRLHIPQSGPSADEPVAKFTTQPTVGLCGDIILDASESYHASAKQLKYFWTIDYYVGAGKVATHQFDTLNAVVNTRSIESLQAHLYTYTPGNSYQISLKVGFAHFPVESSPTAVQTTVRLDRRAPRATILGGPTQTNTPALTRLVGEPVFSDPQNCPPGTPALELANVKSTWTQLSGPAISGMAQNANSDRILEFSSGLPKQNGEYTFNYLVEYTKGGVITNATAHVALTVKQSPLSAIIVGGDRALTQKSVTFSSSCSDPDDSTNAGATYIWSCTPPSGAGSCTMQNQNSEQMTLLNPAEGTYEVGLAYFKDGRNDTTSAKITFTAAKIPSIELSPLPKKVSTNGTLVIRANVEDATSYQWQVKNLNSSKFLTFDSDAVPTGMNKRAFQLNKGQLEEGMYYEFIFTATGEATSNSSVTTYVNTKPHSGFCQTSANNGTALATEFEINAANWVDEDAPLKYSFIYYKVADPTKRFMIQPKSESNTARTLIPFVGKVMVQCIVEDPLGAQTVRETEIILYPSTAGAKSQTDSVANLIDDALTLKQPERAQILITNSLTFMESNSFATRGDAKEKLLTQLKASNTLEYRDATADSVRQQSEILKSLSSVPGELVSKADAISLMKSMTENQQNAIGEDNKQVMGEAISNLFGTNSANPSKSLSDELVAATNNLVKALSSKQTEGAGISIVQTDKLSLGVQKELATDLASKALSLSGGSTPDVQIPTDILTGQNVQETDPVEVKMMVFTDNPYFDATGEQAQNMSSSVFRLKFDSAGSTLPIKGLSEGLTFKVPATLDLTKVEGDAEKAGIRPVCKYWDEATSVWSTDGCKPQSYAADHVVCTCTHTTDFGGFMDYVVPQLNVPTGPTVSINSDNFTTVVVVSVFGGLYVLAMILMEIVHCGCCTLKKIIKPKPVDPEKYERGIIRPALERLKKSHIWLSLLAPAHDEPGFTRSMRLTVIMIIIFGSSGGNALTFGTQQQNYVQTIVAAFASDMLVTPFVLGFSFLFMKIKPYNFRRKKTKIVNEKTAEFDDIMAAKKIDEEGENIELPRLVGFEDIMQTKKEQKKTQSKSSSSSDDLADPTFVAPGLVAVEGAEAPKEMEEVMSEAQSQVSIQVKYRRSCTDVFYDTIDKFLHFGVDKFNKITERATWYGLLMLGVVSILYFSLLAAVCAAVALTMSWLGTEGVVAIATFGVVLYFAGLEILYIQTKIRKFNDTNMKWRSSFETKLQVTLCLLIIGFNLLCLVGSLFLMSIFSFGPIQFYFVLIADCGFLGFIGLTLIWLFFLLRNPKKKVKKKKKQKSFLARAWFPNFMKIPIYLAAWAWLSIMAWLLVLYGVGFDDKYGKGTALKWLLGSATSNAQNVFLKKPLMFLVRTLALVALVHLIEILFLRTSTARQKVSTEEA